jgi:hypothetical protein
MSKITYSHEYDHFLFNLLSTPIPIPWHYISSHFDDDDNNNNDNYDINNEMRQNKNEEN